MATVGTYRALTTELDVPADAVLPDVVVASLIDAAVRIAMGTDTRDMGIIGAIGPDLSARGGQASIAPCDDCGALAGQAHDLSVEH